MRSLFRARSALYLRAGGGRSDEGPWLRRAERFTGVVLIGKPLSVIVPRRVKLGTRSILVAVTTNKPGKVSIGLARGKRTFSQASASMAGGSKGVKLRLPRGLKAGKHVLKVRFRPAGATKPVTVKLAIRLIAAKKARKASVARIASAGIRIDRSTLPAPKLPDGRRP